MRVEKALVHHTSQRWWRQQAQPENAICSASRIVAGGVEVGGVAWWMMGMAGFENRGSERTKDAMSPGRPGG